MWEIGILCGGNLARVGINCKFINIFAEKKTDWKDDLAIWMLYWCVTSLVTLVFHSLSLNVLTNIFFLIILSKRYVRDINKCLFVGILIYFINMACDGLVYILFTQYVAGQQVEIYYSIITVILIFVMEQFAERVISVDGVRELPGLIWSVLISVPLISVIIVYAVVTKLLNTDNRGIIGVIICGVLINNLLIFTLYNSILKLYKDHLEQRDLQRQIESYMNQLEIYRKSQEKYNSLKHDFKKHVGVIFKLLENENSTAVTDYLKKMEINYYNSDEYVACGNKNIDSIFNYMLRDAAADLKDLKIDIKIPEDLNVDLYDINIILGNLLENAIFAANNSNDKLLHINMFMEKMILYIVIKNSYSNEIKYKKGRYITTKLHGHGLGLKNVQTTIKKYDGIMDIQYDGSFFEVSVMLYI